MRNPATGVCLVTLALTTFGCPTIDPVKPDERTGADEFLPSIQGFTADNVRPGAVLEQLGVSPENVVAGLVDSMAECYSRVGAVAGKWYRTPSGDQFGTVAVTNTNLTAEFTDDCLLVSTVGLFFPSGVRPVVCQARGSFYADGDRFAWIYGGEGADFCQAVSSHFQALR